MKVKEKLDELSLSVEKLTKTDGWKDWLKFSAKLHNYSFGNCMLIAAQCPEATYVMPYGAKDRSTGWLSVDRQVQKGEKGLKILAPIIVDDEGEKKLVGFRWTSVFDVSQTEGEPVPELEWPEPTVCPEGLWSRLAASTITSTGLTISSSEEDSLGSARGYLKRKDNMIWVSPELGEPAQVTVLLHELGHYFDPMLVAKPEDYREHRADCELVAESVAWLVATEVGIDCQDEVEYYLATWGDKSSSELYELAVRIDRSYKRVKPILEGAME